MVTRFKAAFHLKSVQNGSRDTDSPINGRDRLALPLRACPRAPAADTGAARARPHVSGRSSSAAPALQTRAWWPAGRAAARRAGRPRFQRAAARRSRGRPDAARYLRSGSRQTARQRLHPSVRCVEPPGPCPESGAGVPAGAWPRWP